MSSQNTFVGESVLLRALVGSTIASSSKNILKDLDSIASYISQHNLDFNHALKGIWGGDFVIKSNAHVAVSSLSSGWYGNVFNMFENPTYGLSNSTFGMKFFVFDEFGNCEFWDGTDAWIPVHVGRYYVYCLGN